MAKIIYDIFDESLLNSGTYNYSLSLFISNHACTYLILDNEKWLAYRSYSLEAHSRTLFSIRDELEMLMNSDKMLKFSFREVKICYLTSAFTMIPEELYSDENLYAYFNSVCPSPASEIIRSEKCGSDIRNLYLVKIELLQFLEASFPGAKMEHFFSGMISSVRKNTDLQDTTLFVNFHLNQMQVLVCNERQILLANNYDFQTPGDVAYFIMLAFDQLGLDPESNAIYLSGHINEKAELYNAICRYVRKVHFRETGLPAFPEGSAFAAYPLHTFVDISQHLLS